MNIRIKNYQFDKTAKTITFSDYQNISLDGVFLVVNVTAKTPLFVAGESGLGGTVSGNVLTLDVNTSTMNNSDSLQIVYNEPSAPDSRDIYFILQRILEAIEHPVYWDPTANAIRNQVQSGTVSTVAALTTLSTLTNVSNIDNYQAKLQPLGITDIAWADMQRRTIS